MTPRIHIEFSSASPMAAILRRGPSDWVRLLAWNTRTDVIEAGSWFHGRIYESECSVSPDGELFAYFATKYHGPKTRGVNYAWTGVSKLPWLTAWLFGLNPILGAGEPIRRQPDTDHRLPFLGDFENKEVRLPEGFAVLPRWIGRDAPKQLLPTVPQSTGSFNGIEGIDPFGRTFRVRRGPVGTRWPCSCRSSRHAARTLSRPQNTQILW